MTTDCSHIKKYHAGRYPWLYAFLLSVLVAPLLAETVETEYYAVFMDNKKVGRAEGLRTVDKGIVRTTEKMEMTIARAGASMTIKTVETVIESKDGLPIGFETEENMAGMAKKVVGKLTNQGKVDITITATGTSQQMTIDWPQGAMMTESLRLLQLQKGLNEATSYQVNMFSPALLAAVPVQISIGGSGQVDLLGSVVELTKVTTTMMIMTESFTSTSYVDKQLSAKKIVMPMLGMNLELVACDKAFALSDNDVVDFLERLLVQCPAPLSDVESKKSITYHIKPIDAAKVKIPSGDSQMVQFQADGTIAVTVRPIEPDSGIKFPYEGDSTEILESLKPTRYLQSDDEMVSDLARRAVSGAEDAATALRQIESFVNGYITAKNLSVGYATAADVAASRQGDCSEHALLAAAMCRSAGIPARVVSGIVYTPSFAGRKDVFIGHAWAEAFVGDKWIAIDPTRAPSGFGPGHIALAAGSGDPVDFFSMISTLGYFTIEKVTCE
jgi:hypothetical protein